MKRRNAVRLVSFLCAGLVALGGFSIKTVQKTNKYKLEIENNYSRSLNDLTAAVNNIALTLKKAQYVTTANQLGQMAVKLLSEAQISKSALAQLPSGRNLESLNRFLSQVGNYAMSVSGELYGGNGFPKDYGDNISVLSQTADKISQTVEDAQINYNNLDYWAKELDQKIDTQVEEGLAVSLSDLEGELTDYPTLVYDGPYSDHILKHEPTMITDGEIVTKQQAQQTAESFCESKSGEMEFIAKEEGKIPQYRFSDGATDITVSEAGGYVVYMRKTRTLGNYVLTYEQALEKAKRFLDRNNMLEFIETYYFTDEGVCVINFAFLDGQTICYTDLIKVGVAMDTGEIMLYEASGYLSNHKERAFETPVYTLEQAKERISDKLTVKKTALALIPTDAGEKRCYEFVCSDNDSEILVYINVLTLEEEQILILLKSDGGSLAK